MISIDEYVIYNMTSLKYTNMKYIEYFAPEIQKYNDIIFSNYPTNKYKDDLIKEMTKEMPENFEENRIKGENHDYICQLIKNDNVIDFISYINKFNISKNTLIQPSIFETNDFLLNEKYHSLIEYAAFFGSIQIFKYLQMNEVQLTPSLWLYSIHSDNPELIHLLEEFHVKPEDNSYNECFLEAIKCHHNNIAKYIQNNYIINQNILFSLNQILQYHNFEFIQDENIDCSIYCELCRYDYPSIVVFLIKNSAFNTKLYFSID